MCQKCIWWWVSASEHSERLSRMAAASVQQNCVTETFASFPNGGPVIETCLVEGGEHVCGHHPWPNMRIISSCPLAADNVNKRTRVRIKLLQREAMKLGPQPLDDIQPKVFPVGKQNEQVVKEGWRQANKTGSINAGVEQRNKFLKQLIEVVTLSEVQCPVRTGRVVGTDRCQPCERRPCSTDWTSLGRAVGRFRNVHWFWSWSSNRSACGQNFPIR